MTFRNLGSVALLVAAPACGLLAPWEPPEVELGEGEVASGTRLQHEIWVSAEGVELPTGVFFDRERKERCEFLPADDGSLRCFPAEAARRPEPFGPWYGDSSCTEEVFPIEPNPTRPWGRTTRARNILVRAESDCGAWQAYELGEIGEAAFVLHRSQCGRLGTSGDLARVGARIPNDAFVRGAEKSVGDGDLRLRQLTAEDGAAFYSGYQDASRGVDCVPVPTSAGTRCVDSSSQAQWLWYREFPEGVPCWDFVLIQDECAAARYGVTRDEDDFQVRELIPEAELETPSPEQETCLAQAHEFETAYSEPRTFWLFGAAVPSDSFPAIRETTFEGERIQASGLERPDGELRLLRPGRFELFDSSRGEECTLEVAADGKTRCLPAIGRGFDYFGGSDCTEPLVRAISVSGEPPPLVRVEDTEGHVHVHEIGEPFSGSTVYYEIPESGCYPDEVSDPLWGLGEELPPELFVEYELVRR